MKVWTGVSCWPVWGWPCKARMKMEKSQYLAECERQPDNTEPVSVNVSLCKTQGFLIQVKGKCMGEKKKKGKINLLRIV